MFCIPSVFEISITSCPHATVAGFSMAIFSLHQLNLTIKLGPGGSLQFSVDGDAQNIITNYIDRQTARFNLKAIPAKISMAKGSQIFWTLHTEYVS